MDTLSFSGLNYVDIAIIVIFLISIITGLTRGFTSELLSLLILIAAFVVALMFTAPLAEYFTNTTTVQNMLGSNSSSHGTNGAAQTISFMTICISFLILFVATIIVGSIIKLLLRLILPAGGYGFGNRLVGGIFGLIRAYLFILIVIFLVQLSPLAKEDWWKQSRYVPKFHSQITRIGDFVSPALKNLKSTFAPESKTEKKETGKETVNGMGQTKDGQMNGQTKDGQMKNGQTKDGQMTNGQPKNGQMNNGQPKDGQMKNGQPKNGQTIKSDHAPDTLNVDQQPTM